MNEIKCPNCGEVFVMDASRYAQIVQQVRDQEFKEELNRRAEEIEKRKKTDVELVKSEQKQEFDQLLHSKELELSKKEKELDQLKARISEKDSEKQLALREVISQKEQEQKSAMDKKNEELIEKEQIIMQLKAQLEKSDTEKMLAVSKAEEKKEQTIAQLKAQLEKSDAEKMLAVSKTEEKKEQIITQLKAQLEKSDADKILAVSKAEEKKEQMIIQLKAQLEKNETEKKLAVSEVIEKKDKQLSEKMAEIIELKGQLSNKEAEQKLNEEALKKEYAIQLKLKEEQIEQYKDFKAKLSTKMIGESLEQHCLNQFNSLRMTAFPTAYFEKDNDIKTGSKGDFIFRDMTDGIEFISIMFEMKNEMDTTATKHKNEDFFKELDKDRREKKCEYAVLVSLLEPDNELYNNGIVDVSYKYEKMYVIRPQFFIPIITLLRNAALNTVRYRRALALARNQQIDILHFEENMDAFKKGFARNYRLASERFKTAIDEIDNTIKHLQKTKEALLSSENNLRLANEKADDLSIKKLTKDAPRVRQMFDEIKKDDKI